MLGNSGGFTLGGGADFWSRHGIFFLASAHLFRRTGERVEVIDGEVLHTGVEDVVTIVPLEFTVGYRPENGWRLAPYIGGGVGRQFFWEDSPYLDESETVSIQATSYHVLGGVQWRVSPRVRTAFEAQYTYAPDAFTEGIAAEYGETNLGGVQVRVKVLFGR